MYPKLSVKLYGKGVTLDAPADGALLRMKRHQIAREGQVILSEIWGKKGAIGFVPPEGDGALCTSHFFLFDVRSEKLDRGWLQALFTANYLERQLGADARGTTGYAAVRPKTLLACEIPLPPLEEQRRIAALIEELAHLIEEARSLREQALVEAEALALSAASMTLGALPVDGTLSEILIGKPRNGWSAKCDNAESGTPVLALSAATGFHYNSAAFKRTSEPTSPEAHYWLQPGDLLITRSNTPDLVGHAAIYDGNPYPCIYPDLMMKLQVDPKAADARFVWAWLQTNAVRDYIRRHAKGTSPTMKKISQAVVLRLPFPVRTALVEQRRIVTYLEGLSARVDALKSLQAKTAADLSAMLPAVLDRAFNGAL
jgi:type I restriction enzyme S subunit